MGTEISTDESYLEHLATTIGAAADDGKLFQAIVDAPFSDRYSATVLGLGVVVLLLVNPDTKTIDRIALSRTEQAQGAVDYSAKPFKEIKIPLGFEGNIIAQAIATGQPQQTDDWQYMFNPALNAEEARFNQAGAGIACSVVYPLVGARDGGALIFSYHMLPTKIGPRHHAFMAAYASLVADRLAAS